MLDQNNSILFSATFSAEDNKLRLYVDERLDRDLFLRLKEAGFRSAPKQGCFFCPKWTPAREDLCLELAGEITAENTTLVERAEAKAARLDDLAQRRGDEANAFHRTANQISERFAMGQPILVGHHSERKARRDQARMHSAMDNSVKSLAAVDYWNWKAEGVERHANRKSKPAVRARRIKTLLAELRDRQRGINHANICIALWSDVNSETDSERQKKLVESYSGGVINTGHAAPLLSGDSLWSQFSDGKLSAQEIIDFCLTHFKKQVNSRHTGRWISHILNRLAFERAELGQVSRFGGELSPVILQAFTREHGAHKPKATKDSDGWTVESSSPLPLHIADGKTLSLNNNQWLDLMQACGYEVPTPKPRRKLTDKKTVPLINPTKEEAARLQEKWNSDAQEKKGHTTLGGIIPSEIRTMKQVVFSQNSKGSYSPYNTIELDIKGNKVSYSWRGATAEPVCRIRTSESGGSLYSPPSIILIDDKPSKALPIEWVEVS